MIPSPDGITADLAGDYRRPLAHIYGDDPLFTVAVNVCENCQQTRETLIHVPKFDYLACDPCYDEAMQIIDTEAAALLKAPPATCGPSPKTVQGDRLSLNQVPVSCEREVA